MILILFPLNVEGLNVEDCKNQFKKAVQISGDEHIKSNNWFL